jgi:hypothetical protein
LSLFWAELRKLPSVMTVAALIGAVLMTLVFIVVFLTSASLNVENARAELEILANTPRVDLCEYVKDGSGRPCDVLVAERTNVAREWLAQLGRSYELRSAIADPFGAGGIAAGFVSSLPGGLAIAFIAALHVSNEWESGIAATRMARDRRRLPFLATKFGAVLVAGLLVLACMWAVVAVVGPLIVSSSSLPVDEPGFSTSSYLVTQLPRSILVVAFFAALGTASGVAVRRALPSFLLTVGVLVLSSVLAFSSGSLSPAGWIAGLMDFQPQSMLADHVWVDQDVALPGHISATIGLTVLTGVLLFVGWYFLRVDPLDR